MNRHTLALTFIITLSFALVNVYAQFPWKFSYQIIVKDQQGSVVSDQFADFDVRIVDPSDTSNVFYREVHNDIEIINGIANLIVGNGESSGDIQDVPWLEERPVLLVSTDLNGDGSYYEVYQNPIMSVPFALVAYQTETDLIEDDDSDPLNEMVSAVILDGNDLTIEEGDHSVSIDLTMLSDGTMDNDADPNNELQSISRNGSVISLSSGGSVLDSVYTYQSGTGITIENNVVSVSDCDYALGDTTEGGVIFYLDWTGCHGLSHALVTYEGIPWDASPTSNWSRILLNTVYAGYINTKMIVNAVGPGFNSGYTCDTLNLGGFSDWYLPSQKELQIIWGFYRTSDVWDNANYWSSLEISNSMNEVYIVRISDGYTGVLNKSNTNVATLPIRRF